MPRNLLNFNLTRHELNNVVRCIIRSWPGLKSRGWRYPQWSWASQGKRRENSTFRFILLLVQITTRKIFQFECKTVLLFSVCDTCGQPCSWDNARLGLGLAWYLHPEVNQQGVMLTRHQHALYLILGHLISVTDKARPLILFWPHFVHFHRSDFLARAWR